MTGVRTFPRQAAQPHKGSRTVSVCVPCRNEEETIGDLVTTIRTEMMSGDAPFVDELIVIDDRSTDNTAIVAADAGAHVVSIDDIHAAHGVGQGKGNALWASLIASTGDVVVWCDGDVTSLEGNWISNLARPLLDDDSVALVKAMYDRPTDLGGGGRTTELVARPMLSRWFPELTAVAQPLTGEYAVRRSVVEELELEQGWGVEIGLLIDIAEAYTPRAIAQVDLGTRLHRHRPLESLSVQAAEVMAAVLDRVGDVPAGRRSSTLTSDTITSDTLKRADGTVVELNNNRRPSVASVRAATRQPTS